MHRVLILRSNPIAPDPRVEKIAAALQSGDYQVRVLGWDRFGQSPTTEYRNGFIIQRLSIVAGFGKGIRNIGPLLRWQWSLLNWLIQHRADFDIVHACDFDTILPAIFCKYRYGKKVVYDIFDFYADHLRATPTLIKKIIRWVDFRVIGQADGVILVDEARRDQIAGSKPKRLEIIYNSPADANSFGRTEDCLRGDSRFRIAYVGLLQVERGLLAVIDVIARNQNWTLEIAGFGGDESLIRELSSPLCNVVWHGRVDYERAIEISRQADVLFATYDPTIPNHRYSSPNKVFEAMMLGKPIIVSRDTNMDQIILSSDCGLVVNYGSVDELEAAFQKLLRDDGFRVRLGNNARKAYETRYSWKNMTERLLHLYHQICP